MCRIQSARTSPSSQGKGTFQSAHSVLRFRRFVNRRSLILQFTKRKDGGALLRCIRADDSTTWQRQDDNRAAFLPLHDLTHYAVETELGFGCGFYGLVADGWEIADTTGKGASGPLPDEAIEVEYIVGSLGAERTGASACTAKEFNQLASAFAKTRGRPEPRPLTDAELTRVRSRIHELFTRWRALPPGATLELAFPFQPPPAHRYQQTIE
jgi:hypothetical protein